MGVLQHGGNLIYNYTNDSAVLSSNSEEKRIMDQKPFSIGDKVKGVYYGQPYTGVVEYARPHTMNQSYKHHIVLDQPITVFSAQRDRIIVSIWEPRESGNTIEAV